MVWPTKTEEGRAVLSWHFLSSLQPDAVDLPLQIYRRMLRNIDDMVQRFADEAFTPLFEWLAEQLQYRSSAVHTLRRYVYLTERFNRVDLGAQFSKRSETGEELYNDELQKFLFQDAHYVTYAKPRSATGGPDLIGELEGEDPMVMDGTLYKGGVAYVAKGVRQVYEYAQDYGKNWPNWWSSTARRTAPWWSTATAQPTPGHRTSNWRGCVCTSWSCAQCRQRPRRARWVR